MRTGEGKGTEWRLTPSRPYTLLQTQIQRAATHLVDGRSLGTANSHDLLGDADGAAAHANAKAVGTGVNEILRLGRCPQQMQGGRERKKGKFKAQKVEGVSVQRVMASVAISVAVAVVGAVGERTNL